MFDGGVHRNVHCDGVRHGATHIPHVRAVGISAK